MPDYQLVNKLQIDGLPNNEPAEIAKVTHCWHSKLNGTIVCGPPVLHTWDCSSGRQARGRSSCCAPRLVALHRRHAQQWRRWTRRTHDNSSTHRSAAADKLSSAPAPTGQLKALRWQYVRAAGVSVAKRLAVATWQQQQGRQGRTAYCGSSTSTAGAKPNLKERQTRGVNSKRPLRRGHKPAQRTVPSIAYVPVAVKAAGSSWRACPACNRGYCTMHR
jgi:hypothetical protein